MHKTKISKAMAFKAMLLATAIHTAPVFGSPFLSGTFSNDADIAWRDFNLVGNSVFTAYSTSFGVGGFAPVLSLFAMNSGQDLLRIELGSANTCTTAGAGAASDGLCWDAAFTQLLGAGSYRLVVSQDGNTPNGPDLPDGFAQTGNPHYTGINYLGNSSLSFVNFDGVQRTGFYEVETQISSAMLPEPASLGIFFPGLALIYGFSRRAKKPDLLF